MEKHADYRTLSELTILKGHARHASKAAHIGIEPAPHHAALGNLLPLDAARLKGRCPQRSAAFVHYDARFAHLLVRAVLTAIVQAGEQARPILREMFDAANEFDALEKARRSLEIVASCLRVKVTRTAT